MMGTALRMSDLREDQSERFWEQGYKIACEIGVGQSSKAV